MENLVYIYIYSYVKYFLSD